MATSVKLISDDEATPEVKQMFDQVKQQMGMVPPTIRAMANKPDYLKLYLENDQTSPQLENNIQYINFLFIGNIIY